MKNAFSFESTTKKLQSDISEKRYQHSVRVMETCLELIKKLEIDVNLDTIRYAAILHDCARDKSNFELEKMLKDNNIKISELEKIQPVLLHAKAGAILAKEKYGIKDPHILNAIRYHTTAKANMSKIDKILFVSDYIEPERQFFGIDEIRNIVYNSLDNGVKCVLKSKIMHVVKNEKLLHIDTIKAINWIFKKDNILKIGG
jgi:predicted HD superfamily hydrolase involved in NAD metabolism